jgi:UDP-N-acetylglucosamine 2-epimerase (non-hydrolysing)
MQEEACGLHIPCITVRYVTDRPESVEAGANVLCPPDSPERFVKAAEHVEKNHQKMSKARNPYGEGDASRLIFDAIEEWHKKGKDRLIGWEHGKNRK